MNEVMTADESAAMEAMKADTGPAVEAADVVDVPQEAAATAETPVAVEPRPRKQTSPRRAWFRRARFIRSVSAGRLRKGRFRTSSARWPKCRRRSRS